MASFSPKLLLVVSLITYSFGTRVELFQSNNFTGNANVVTSSKSCQSIPTDFRHLSSIKTTGCIAVFYQDSCLNENSGRWDIIVRSRVTHLGYGLKSFRNCNDLETGPQVNLDYYAEGLRRGSKLEFRDVCSCTNIAPRNTSLQSTYNYGNCLLFYTEIDCGGKSTRTDSRSFTYEEYSSRQSFMPCEVPNHCKERLTATIINITPTSNIMQTEGPLRRIAIIPKRTFINNGAKAEIYHYTATKEISETIQLTPPEHFKRMKYTVENHIVNQNVPRFVVNAFAGEKTNYTIHPLPLLLKSMKEFRFQKTITMELCTKYEIAPFVEMADNAGYQYQAKINITGEKIGTARMSADEIQNILKNVTSPMDSSSDDFSVSVETTINMTTSYVVDFGVDVTSTLMTSCIHHYPKFFANILHYEPLSNITTMQKATKSIPISSQQTFLNNGSATEENKYEVAMEISELGQFELPKELNEFELITFGNVGIGTVEKSIPLLAFAWEKLKTQPISASDRQSSTNETVTFGVQRNKEFRVHKKINLPPCTKYVINSFVEMAENVEVLYRLQIKVTAQLELDQLRAEDIRKYFKHATFSNDTNTDEYSILLESTLKLTLNYGVTSLDNGESTPMFDCIAAQAALVANCSFTCY